MGTGKYLVLLVTNFLPFAFFAFSIFIMKVIHAHHQCRTVGIFQSHLPVAV